MKKVIVVVFILLFSLGNSFAADDPKIQELQNDIAILKRIVNEQDERIKVLESKILEMNAGSFNTDTNLPQKVNVKTSQIGDWKIPSNWDKIVRGMSEQQVRSILGSPSSVKDLGQFRTLFYRGDVSGSGFVSGNIEISDDRVWQINKPVF